MKKINLFVLLFLFVSSACTSSLATPINSPTPHVVIVSTNDISINFLALDCFTTAVTQLDMTKCAEQKAKDSQQKLDQLLDELQQHYAGSDFGNELMQVEGEWEALREHDCLWEKSFSENGSTAPMIFSLCVFRYNTERISRLKLFLCEGAGMTGECEESKKYDDPDEILFQQP